MSSMIEVYENELLNIWHEKASNVVRKRFPDSFCPPQIPHGSSLCLGGVKQQIERLDYGKALHLIMTRKKERYICLCKLLNQIQTSISPTGLGALLPCSIDTLWEWVTLFFLLGVNILLLTYSMEQSPTWEADQSSQLVKKFPAFYVTRSFFTVPTSTNILLLSISFLLFRIPNFQAENLDHYFELEG
jgi:hypothetical protein